MSFDSLSIDSDLSKKFSSFSASQSNLTSPNPDIIQLGQPPGGNRPSEESKLQAKSDTTKKSSSDKSGSRKDGQSKSGRSLKASFLTKVAAPKTPSPVPGPGPVGQPAASSQAKSGEVDEVRAMMESEIAEQEKEATDEDPDLTSKL